MAGRPQPPEFVNARRLAGLALICTGIALSLWDAVTDAYQLSPTILAVFILGGLAMFGLAQFNWPFGSK